MNIALLITVASNGEQFVAGVGERTTVLKKFFEITTGYDVDNPNPETHQSCIDAIGNFDVYSFNLKVSLTRSGEEVAVELGCTLVPVYDIFEKALDEDVLPSYQGLVSALGVIETVGKVETDD